MISWTDAMYEFLRNNFQTMEDREIAEFFTKSCGIPVNVKMVQHARARMGLSKFRYGDGKSGEVSKKLKDAWRRAKGQPGRSG